MKHTECEDCKLRKGDCGYHFKMDGKTNYNIASLSACDQYGNCMFFKPKAKPTGNLINREDLKYTMEFIELTSNTYEEMVNRYKKAIDDAPAVDAIVNTIEVRPTGEWTFEPDIITLGNPYGSYRCSNCKNIHSDDVNYCPNCGAQMKWGNR